MKQPVTARAESIFEESGRRLHERTDRLFAGLLGLQFAAGIVAALVISPRAWAGPLSHIHIHVWTAVLLGGLISALPIALAVLRPGQPTTRYVIAIAQMLASALLIHLSGGRIETHFHVFGSLAFLAFYRDWRVFVPATVVVALDHLIRGIFWPQSVFGVLTASQWRWLEHAAWVLFEDIFLVRSCLQGVTEMRETAGRQARLEATNEIVETAVFERTRELNESEARFRSISECSPLGVFQFSGHGMYEYANDRMMRILGVRRQNALRAIAWFSRVHDEDRALAVADWTAAGLEDRPFLRDCRVIRPDGQVRWLRVRASRVAGVEESWVGTAEDVTEERVHANQLAALKRHFELILDSVEDGIIGIDLARKITFINSFACRSIGWSEEQTTRRALHDVVLPESRREGEWCAYQVLTDGKPRSFTDQEFRRRDGATFPVELSVAAIRENERIVGAVVTFCDVSEKRRMEAQLLQARKLESIGQLAAGIAHEINTPTQYVGDNTRFLHEAFNDVVALLAAMSGLQKAGALCPELAAAMERADTEYLVEEIPKAIQQSLEGIERVAKIVRAMKEFSHPGGEGRTPVDLNQAITSTITVARNEWKYVADLVTDFDPELPPVPCMVGDLNQVMLNLIVNAAHAIADVVGDGCRTKGTITISTRREGDWVRIRVADTGTGIPEEIRANIFDPFFTTKPVGKGTGQGLNIAHTVVTKKHGGTISVESEVGRGTALTIRLPMVVPEEAIEESSACAARI